jgi:photosystem II stability/assembly factor-like uncharacterized protein
MIEVKILLSILLLAILGIACEQEDTALSVNIRSQVKYAQFDKNQSIWLVTEKDGDLLFSTIGKKDWVRISGKNVGGRFDSVFFINQSQGWAVNQEGQIWKTLDGGNNWVMISVLASNASEGWSFLSSMKIFFFDSLNGWILETFSIWKTNDGGATWERIFSLTPNVHGQPIAGYFATPSKAVIGGTNGEIYSTIDGKTWKISKVLEQKGDFHDIYFLNNQNGWAIGYNMSLERSQLYQTSNGGETWHLISELDMYANKIFFVNEHEGWIAGETNQKFGNAIGIVLHTDDSGATWKPVQVGLKESSFNDIYFVDKRRGWLIGNNNIYNTADGGNNWKTVLSVTH